MHILILVFHSLKCEFFAGYKQAHRKGDDIATVNSGIRVKMDTTMKKVTFT